jgi:hypothetical protein
VIRQIDIEVKALEIAVGLLLRLLDQLLRERHPARFMMRVRQREEARRPHVERSSSRSAWCSQSAMQ